MPFTLLIFSDFSCFPNTKSHILSRAAPSSSRWFYTLESSYIFLLLKSTVPLPGRVPCPPSTALRQTLIFHLSGLLVICCVFLVKLPNINLLNLNIWSLIVLRNENMNMLSAGSTINLIWAVHFLRSWVYASFLHEWTAIDFKWSFI